LLGAAESLSSYASSYTSMVYRLRGATSLTLAISTSVSTTRVSILWPTTSRLKGISYSFVDHTHRKWALRENVGELPFYGDFSSGAFRDRPLRRGANNC
jgi:hypothetical protein